MAAAGCAGGNRVPGVARSGRGVALRRGGHGGWRGGRGGQGIGAVGGNDADCATAPGFALLGAHLGFRKQFGRTSIDTSLRLHNLLDHRHVSAVVVNQAQDRYFEPGPGRGAFIAIRIQRILPGP